MSKLTTTVEEAKMQAEAALAALGAYNWQVDREAEMELIGSLDQDCPECGVIQPDDDSSNCWLCGACLDPDDYCGEDED